MIIIDNEVLNLFKEKVDLYNSIKSNNGDLSILTLSCKNQSYQKLFEHFYSKEHNKDKPLIKTITKKQKDVYSLCQSFLDLITQSDYISVNLAPTFEEEYFVKLFKKGDDKNKYFRMVGGENSQNLAFSIAKALIKSNCADIQERLHFGCLAKFYQIDSSKAYSIIKNYLDAALTNLKQNNQ